MVDQKPPEKLIKYYKCDKYSCDALTNNYLWASHPASFNDPFDCPVFTLKEESFRFDILLKITNPLFHELWSLNNAINRHDFYSICLGFIGIVCLNEYETDNQDILWGYYSDQEGFAIEFDQKELSKDLNGSLEKIDYRDVDSFETFGITDEPILMNSTLTKWIKQKKKVWNKETEWRYIFFDCEIDPKNFLPIVETRKKKYKIDDISTIYLGHKFFKLRNLVEVSNNSFVYILSKEINQQNQLLSFLASHPDIKVEHMFPKNNELQLFPREFRIAKQDEGRFKIKYT
jgi:hypothetical protein